MKLIIEKLKNFFLVRNTYDNIIDASYSSLMIKKLTGASVLTISLRPGNVVDRRFCPLGFLLFVFWNSAYLFCAYKVFNYDMTIFDRKLNSHLKGYGTGYERLSSWIFVIFTMFVTPFRVSGNKDFIQKILDIDKNLIDSGECIDFNKIAKKSFILVFSIIAVYIQDGVFCIFLQNYKWVFSMEQVFVIAYTDFQATLILMTFTNYLLILRERFELIKQALISIKEASHWKSNAFHRDEIPNNLVKVAQLNEQQICEKIRSCAKIHTMLCKSCYLLMNMIGFSIVSCMLMYFGFIVLYIYYFMEAIAIGKLTNYEEYTNFITICVWGVTIAFAYMFSVIYFSESTMKQVS